MTGNGVRLIVHPNEQGKNALGMWVAKNLTPHPGAPDHGIYKRESPWRYTLVD